MQNRRLSLCVGWLSFALTSMVVAAPDQLVSGSTGLTSYSVKHIKPVLEQDTSPAMTVFGNTVEDHQNGLLYPSLVDYLYSRLGVESLWTENELNAQLNLQLDIMRLAGFSPLFQSRVEQLQQHYQQGDMNQYDKVATDTFLLYLSYVAESQDKGREWLFTTDLVEPLSRPSATEVDLMVKAFEVGNELRYITSFASPMLKQDGFESAYIDLVSKSQMTNVDYEQFGLKRLGDSFPDASYSALLERLSESNIFVAAREDRVFDESLELAIRQFQTIYGLNDDGIIGPNTIEWLNKSASDKLRILALNSERSRLWPQQRDNIILVNVPNFQLQYWDDGEERFESRVIVGRASRQTPLLETKMDSLILNPTWNVPWKIMVKDIIPKVKRNPTYLFAQRIEILEGWNNQVTIDPTMIDWQQVNARRFPYRMRQQAGELNALGQYKFNTPNAQAIFLHDTPSKHLFDESLRAFSSGCVRVEHADQFAQVLLEAQGKTLQDVATERPNKAIALKQLIPVHIIYQTAWMADGKTHFRGDVYRYDVKRESIDSAALSKN